MISLPVLPVKVIKPGTLPKSAVFIASVPQSVLARLLPVKLISYTPEFNVWESVQLFDELVIVVVALLNTLPYATATILAVPVAGVVIALVLTAPGKFYTPPPGSVPSKDIDQLLRLPISPAYASITLSVQVPLGTTVPPPNAPKFVTVPATVQRSKRLPVGL